MSVKINLGAWNSVFAVPSKVVDEGLKFSDGVKLKVLLYVLRNAGGQLDKNSISAATGVNVTDIPEALEYWVSMGIFEKADGDFTPLQAEPVNPVQKEEPVQPKQQAQTAGEIARDVNEAKRRFVVTKPQKPDYVFTAQRLAVDNELKILVQEAQAALGKTLSNSDTATLLMLKDTCGLHLDVILMLIQYCISIDKANMRTVEKIGVSWADEGINSVEAADDKIRQAHQASKSFSIVSSAFGLKNAGSPTKKQLEYSSKWVGEWKFSQAMLREAYERCVDKHNTIKWNYIDGILKRWHASNILNLEELKEFESKTSKPEKQSNASYDIKELEKINTLDYIE
ncbi:MAG: DnaD domain protein [Ruminococcus sp.]|nr:DnaD domain protein [Ruminococcus sp.]